MHIEYKKEMHHPDCWRGASLFLHLCILVSHTSQIYSFYNSAHILLAFMIGIFAIQKMLERKTNCQGTQIEIASHHITKVFVFILFLLA